MTITNKRKLLLDMLLLRWKALSQYGAIERLHRAVMEQTGEQDILFDSDVIKAKPVDQIELIKSKIIEILPETSFIKPTYEAPAELRPEDFMQMYVDHQELCINKVKDLMKKMRIK